MKRTLLILVLLSTAYWVNGQSRQVSGEVTDLETKDPLPGATVVVKGTKNATTTGPGGILL